MREGSLNNFYKPSTLQKYIESIFETINRIICNNLAGNFDWSLLDLSMGSCSLQLYNSIL